MRMTFDQILEEVVEKDNLCFTLPESGEVIKGISGLIREAATMSLVDWRRGISVISPTLTSIVDVDEIDPLDDSKAYVRRKDGTHLVDINEAHSFVVTELTVSERLIIIRDILNNADYIFLPISKREVSKTIRGVLEGKCSV